MKQILTVAKQVFLKNIKSWGFYLMVLGPILFMVIMGLVGYFMSEDNMDSDETDQTTVALVSEDPAMEEYFSVLNNEDSPLEMTTDYSNAKEAEKAYNDDDIQGFVTVDTNETPVSATVYHNGELSTHLPAIHQVLSQVQRNNAATQIGLTEAELGQLNTPAVMEESDIEVKDTAEGDAEDDVDPLQLGVSYIVTILLFFFISFYSGMICEEIATEKGSRVMEVILSSITATQHFFGKLLGLAFTILVHISLYIVLGGLAFFGINQLFEENLLAFLTDIIDFKAIIGEFLGITLLLSILGIIMYAVISAFLGSLATKTEDANKVMLPLVFLLLAGFYIGMFAMGGGTENIIIRVGSYLPFWTPLVMPFRMASNSVGTLELWLSLAGMILFTILVTWLSLMFYRSNVLVYSQANAFKQLKRSWSINKSNRQAQKSH